MVVVCLLLFVARCPVKLCSWANESSLSNGRVDWKLKDRTDQKLLPLKIRPHYP